jgi:hypothetical protein
MLLLDTSQYSVGEREEVIREGLAEMAGVQVQPIAGDGPIKMRLRAWDMGDGCNLVDTESSGYRFLRPPSDFSADSPVVGFAMMPSGTCRFSQHDRHEIVPSGGLFIVDMTDAYDYQFSQVCDGANLIVPLELLDIPLRDVRKAAQWLPRSPLYGLASQHLYALLRYTKEFDAPHPSAQQAALHMMRALVKSFDD